MTIVRRIANTIERVVPDPAIRYAEDLVRGRRFDARARAYRDRYGLEVAERRLTVLTFPEPVAMTPLIVVGRLCAALGYRVVALPARSYDIAFKYHDSTFTDVSLTAPFRGGPSINTGSLDISKARVDREFEAVFGRATLLDPRHHVGPMVEKPNLNSKRGIRLVDGPAEPRDGFVYQRLIDSSVDDAHYLEYRVPCYDGVVPLVYRQIEREEERFKKIKASVEILAPDDCFSPEELAGIAGLCKAMGVEFGELDVIRDRRDGDIYVVDVNNTPYGPPVVLDDAGHVQAVRILSDAFRRMCEARVDA